MNTNDKKEKRKQSSPSGKNKKYSKRQQELKNNAAQKDKQERDKSKTKDEAIKQAVAEDSFSCRQKEAKNFVLILKDINDYSKIAYLNHLDEDCPEPLKKIVESSGKLIGIEDKEMLSLYYNNIFFEDKMAHNILTYLKNIHKNSIYNPYPKSANENEKKEIDQGLNYCMALSFHEIQKSWNYKSKSKTNISKSITKPFCREIFLLVKHKLVPAIFLPKMV